jgi:MFS transporter, SP family, solute carrier family 2 (myo-inositol transporter), member 13
MIEREYLRSEKERNRYNLVLLFVAGLGGLLYGVDVGIIGGALPYLEATSHLSPGQLSTIVAAVLLGSVFSTLFAGFLADRLGRRSLMQWSAVAFIISIPIIAFSGGYETLFFGRLLQGASGGLIGVVVPLYLAECLSAANRGRGTAAFQWLLTLGIFVAALVGIYFSYRVAAVERTGDALALFQFKDYAWREIFWVSLPPGVLFLVGTFYVSESPRWLFRKGRHDRALIALLRSRSEEQSRMELAKMEEITVRDRREAADSEPGGGSLFRRRFIVPFLLACLILICNQTTGINSIIGFNTVILTQSGLSDLGAHWGYVFFTIVNFLMTMVGMALVDRMGRRFLLVLGTAGIIAATSLVGFLFLRSERNRFDARTEIESLVENSDTLNLKFSPAMAERLLNGLHDGHRNIDPKHASLTIIYSYGNFVSTTNSVQSSDTGAGPIEINRANVLPGNSVEAFFKNPFADLDTARSAPLKIERAMIGAIPSRTNGFLVESGIYLFIAFFALGPGVCVWLALSELMPTRIRSNGMSTALVLNQMVSTIIAATFLPFVSYHGYSSIFFLFAGATVIYLLAAVFLLPETRGKTLEEIEAYFDRDTHANSTVARQNSIRMQNR